MNIGILGLGLIGGSLGLDLRKQGHYVLGVSRRESTCLQAIALGVVDTASVDLGLLSQAEIVFICTPIGLIIPTIEQLIAYLPNTTFITDVASVKTPIVDAISDIWENFIGGHPMAGNTLSGIAAAQVNLFTGNPYVLTPISTTPPRAIALMEKLVEQLGAKIYYCSPSEHDRAVALISHLPVIVSAALIATCENQIDSKILQLAQNLASSGFRDTSRVGGGNPELGTMMARYNRQALLPSLQQYRQQLDNLINLIELEDWKAIEQQLLLNQQARCKYWTQDN